jgi:hypothetical protein
MPLKSSSVSALSGYCERKNGVSCERVHSSGDGGLAPPPLWPARPCIGLPSAMTSAAQSVRVWVQKYEADDIDEDAVASDLLQQYEARIGRWNGLSVNRRSSLSF